MASREALRTQLDALQTEQNALEAENHHLREDRPEQFAALQADQELAQTRDVNARLEREVKQLYEHSYYAGRKRPRRKRRQWLSGVPSWSPR